MKWVGGILSIVLLLAAALVVVPAALGEPGEEPSVWAAEEVRDEAAVPEAADLQAAFFAETRHNVKGAFAAFFWAHGAESALGRPLSEEFVDGATLRQVFEHVALERSLQDDSVHLVPIGALLAGRADLGVSGKQASVAECLVEFYLAHGGQEWFGEPVAEAISEGGAVVQAFEYGSLEWHGIVGGEGQVRIGRLGATYLEHALISTEAIEPALPWMEESAINSAASETASSPRTELDGARQTYAPGDRIVSESEMEAPPVLPLVEAQRGGLSLDAMVKYPQTGQGGYQIVYLTTRDSRGARLADVEINLIVRYPNRDVRSFLTRTGETGRAAVTFEIGYSRPGLPVLIDLTAVRGDMRASTQLDFTPWW